MQFINEAPLYKIVRITGPKHNFLGLELSAHPLAHPPEMEVLDKQKGAGTLIAADVLAEVLAGLESASIGSPTKFHIKKIQFLASDSHPVTVYRDLTRELISRVAQSQT